MKPQRWRERMLDSTRGQILALLRVESCTVNELAAALKLTDNAVRAHLISLERDGLIQREGSRPGLRKPHASHGLTADAEQIFPKEYRLFLHHLMSSISQKLTSRQHRASMLQEGRFLAKARCHESTNTNQNDR